MNMHSDTPRTPSALRQDALIEATYLSSRDALCGYIYKRIGLREAAEDIAQEVFLRLLEYPTLLDSRTVLPFVYSIARNRVIDYLRRHARTRAAAEYFSLHARRASYDTQERIAAGELVRMEKRTIERMPPRRAQVYRLCVHDGCTADEAALTLSLSRRTVENHLFAARRTLRNALGECI